jgi:hypothetical protein
MTLATYLQISSNHYFSPSKLAIGCVYFLFSLFGLGAEKHKLSFGGVTLLAPGTTSSRKVAEIV